MIPVHEILIALAALTGLSALAAAVTGLAIYLRVPGEFEEG